MKNAVFVMKNHILKSKHCYDESDGNRDNEE